MHSWVRNDVTVGLGKTPLVHHWDLPQLILPPATVGDGGKTPLGESRNHCWETKCHRWDLPQAILVYASVGPKKKPLGEK